MKRITQQMLDVALRRVRMETFERAYELGLHHGKVAVDRERQQYRESQDLQQELAERQQRFVESLRT